MKSKTICSSKGCRKPCREGRTICGPCIYKRYKGRHPVEVAYQQLRQNARRRGKEFTITLDYFREWAYEVDLLVGRGRTAKSYHVDRIDDAKGYVPGNLQKLTNSDNVKKENDRRRKVLSYDYHTGEGRFNEPRDDRAPDCPF